MIRKRVWHVYGRFPRRIERGARCLVRLKRRVVTRCSPNSYVAYDRFFFSNVFDIRSMIGHSRVLCVMQSVAQNEIDQLKVALQSEQQQLDDERNEQQRLRHLWEEQLLAQQKHYQDCRRQLDLVRAARTAAQEETKRMRAALEASGVHLP